MTGRRRAAPKHAPSNPAPALWRPMAMAAAALENERSTDVCANECVQRIVVCFCRRVAALSFDLSMSKRT